MRWEDERYVRVYTRDTVDWLALSWDAQALLMQLLRKVDRAGLLPLTRHGKRGVAVAVGHPSLWARIEPALDELLADGCIEIRANVLLFRNFIAAQEAPQSDRQRKAESRARAADLAAAGLEQPDRSIVYFVRSESGGPIKIGVAVDVKSRVSNIQVGRPDRVLLIATEEGGREKERELHRRFATARIDGEWFTATEELLRYIENLSRPVTACPPDGQNVTPGHEASRGVTFGHPVPFRAVPGHSVPSQDLPPSASASAAPGQGSLLPEVPPTPAAKPAKKAKEAKKPDAPTDPRHADLVAKLTAEGWPFDGGKDAANVKALLGLADQQEATRGELAGMEVLRRARIAWAQFPSFHSARTLSGLRTKWGEFATPEHEDGGRVSDGMRPTAPDACAGCGSPGEGASVGEPEVFLGYGCGCMSAWGTAQNQGLHFTKAAEWAAKRKRAA